MSRLLIVIYAMFTCERIDKIIMQYIILLLMLDNKSKQCYKASMLAYGEAWKN